MIWSKRTSVKVKAQLLHRPSSMEANSLKAIYSSSAVPHEAKPLYGMVTSKHRQPTNRVFLKWQGSETAWIVWSECLHTPMAFHYCWVFGINKHWCEQVTSYGRSQTCMVWSQRWKHADLFPCHPTHSFTLWESKGGRHKLLHFLSCSKVTIYYFYGIIYYN